MNTSQFSLANNGTNYNGTRRNFSAPQISLPIYIAADIVYLTVIVSNAAVLLPFIFKRSLRTPFAVYVMNLSFANCLRLTIQVPFAVLSHVYPINGYPPNRDLCSFTLYSTTVLGVGAVNMHALIAINRMWAILRPLSYRRTHTVRFALISCVVLWTYTNVLMGIHPLVERLLERAPNLNLSCAQSMTKFSKAIVITSFTGYLIPLAVTLLPFPVIFCAMFRPQCKSNPSSVQPVDRAGKHDTAAGPSNQTASTCGNSVATQTSITKHPADRTHGLKIRTREMLRFLGLLTGSIIICYVPFFTYYGLQILVPNFYYPTWFAVLQLVFQCQAIMDAALFVLMLKDLRLALGRCLCRYLRPQT